MTDSIGIVSRDQGSYVAVRQARENDDQGNTRFVQLVDFVSRALDSLPTVRGQSSAVSSADGVDFSTLSGEIITSMLDVGDQSVLVVAPDHGANDGQVTVTPLIYNEAGDTVMSVLESKTSGIGSAQFTDGSRYVSPQLQWDLMGAPKVALHITSIGGTSNDVTLKGAVL